jgi:type II secretory ATPase GspE/PulE/Tfp pilus assembly ATPase PilB-like protein
MCLTDDGVLYVAAAHSNDLHVLSFMSRLRHANFQFRIERIQLTKLRELYQNALAHTKYSPNYSLGEENTSHQLEVSRLIKKAVDLGASDVHFIVGPQICKVKFRIDGELKEQPEYTAEHGKALCSTIYQAMCDVADPTYNAGKSQDARMKRSFVEKCGLLGARIGTRPTDDGSFMELRLLFDRRGARPTLETLGYLPEQIALLRRVIHRSTGFNILSGGTGSGKSTTLECALTILMQFFENKINLLTIEDPPEYKIPGAIQTPILCDKDDEEAVSLAWARAIANAMRLDPDVMMIGEVRDLNTAVAAFRAAMTGHGVWTTVHANDLVSVLERLRDLGVSISLLTDPSLITSLVSQSLVRKLCPHCRKPYLANKHMLSADLVERIERACMPEGIFLKGNGCDHCKGSGIAGRMVAAEIALPTKAFMDVFKSDGKVAAREYWVKNMNGITKCQHLLRLVNSGLVDPRLGERDVGFPLDEDLVTLEF